MQQEQIFELKENTAHHQAEHKMKQAQFEGFLSFIFPSFSFMQLMCTVDSASNLLMGLMVVCHGAHCTC